MEGGWVGGGMGWKQRVTEMQPGGWCWEFRSPVDFLNDVQASACTPFSSWAPMASPTASATLLRQREGVLDMGSES